MERRTDTASRLIAAPPDAVFAAFARSAVMTWLPPNDMTGRALEYELRSGGRYRIELTYRGDAGGKTTQRTDVTSGQFLAVEPTRIVQTVEFQSDDEAFAGTMTMTWSFTPSTDGTLVTITAENVPPGISAEEHAVGLRSSLDNLARYVTQPSSPTGTTNRPSQ